MKKSSDKSKNGAWVAGRYVNEFGDKTGTLYISRKISGTAVNKEDRCLCTVEFVVDRESITIEIDDKLRVVRFDGGNIKVKDQESKYKSSVDRISIEFADIYDLN